MNSLYGWCYRVARECRLTQRAGSSTLLTVFGRMIVPENFLIEDGSKLLSQVTWMAYLARRSAEAVRAER